MVSPVPPGGGLFVTSGLFLTSFIILPNNKQRQRQQTETDDQKLEVMNVTQSEKEAMLSQLEAAGVENTEQIAELEDASTQVVSAFCVVSVFEACAG